MALFFNLYGAELSHHSAVPETQGFRIRKIQDVSERCGMFAINNCARAVLFHERFAVDRTIHNVHGELDAAASGEMLGGCQLIVICLSIFGNARHPIGWRGVEAYVDCGTIRQKSGSRAAIVQG